MKLSLGYRFNPFQASQNNIILLNFCKSLYFATKDSCRRTFVCWTFV